MPYSESNKRAVIKYKKNNCRRVEICFNKKYDQETIDFLDSLPNASAYIKELIKKDMMNK